MKIYDGPVQRNSMRVLEKEAGRDPWSQSWLANTESGNSLAFAALLLTPLIVKHYARE